MSSGIHAQRVQLTAHSVHISVIGALCTPETSIITQKRHPYTGKVNPDMPGHIKTVLLHWGHV